MVSKEHASHYTVHYSVTIDSTSFSFPLLSSYSAVLRAASLSSPIAELGRCEPVSYTTHCSLPFVFLSTATAFRSLPVVFLFSSDA